MPEAGDEYVDSAVRAARETVDEGSRARTPGPERARLMRNLVGLIEANAKDLARIETTDNGKLLRETPGQLDALPDWYHYFAGAGRRTPGRDYPDG